jgi:hypothetical protein
MTSLQVYAGLLKSEHPDVASGDLLPWKIPNSRALSDDSHDEDISAPGMSVRRRAETRSFGRLHLPERDYQARAWRNNCISLLQALRRLSAWSLKDACLLASLVPS